MANELIQYYRGKHPLLNNGKRNTPVGVFVAVKLDDTRIGIGWSRCCRRDKWDRSKALHIARERAPYYVITSQNDVLNTKNMPSDMTEQHKVMMNRAASYFLKNNSAAVTA